MIESIVELIEKNPDLLAEKIATLDPNSIIIVALISDMGEIFGFYVNDSFRSSYSMDRKKYSMTAARLSVGFGSALATDKDGVASETEAIVVIRRTTIHYYTRIPDSKKSNIVAVWFSRNNADITTMSDKIRGFLSS